jgi:hypothetical protein
MVLTEHGTTITAKKNNLLQRFESTEIIKDKFVKLLSKHCGKTINRILTTRCFGIRTCMPELMIGCLLAEDEDFVLREEIPTKSDKLKYRKFYLIMISEWILFGRVL